MDLVKLLDEDYESIEAADCPPNLCEHMVRYIQAEYFAKGKRPNAAFVSELLKQTTSMLRVLPNVIEVNRSRLEDNSGFKGRVTVIGDLHGQYRDLEYLLSTDGPVGFPSPDNQIVVNGDMVDRGDMSVEIILVLSMITVLSPGSVHVLRGNHEATPKLADAYGFHLELRQKFDEAPEVTLLFVQLLDVLPVAAVIDDAIFVVHGGIGHFTHTMRPIQLNRGNRFTPCVAGTPLYELLWNGKHCKYHTFLCESSSECTLTHIFMQILKQSSTQLLIAQPSVAKHSILHTPRCFWPKTTTSF